MKRLIFLFVLLSILFSCNDDENNLDCSLVDCAGFPSLNFELLVNGENAFTADLLNIDEISLTGIFPDHSELTTFEVNLANGETEILFLNSFAWEEGTYDFNLNIGSEYTSKIVVEVEETPKGGCCGGIPFFTSLQIDGEVIQNPNSVITLDIAL
ncbi:hypothetical protein [Croceitalea rosinachiae]|uniref:Uncharacterized protein n=1 Tax=Croceitalea rosinachiae TaxID=3075596 RepID=A0ABU3AAH8_9FLAO|nr:hypothetical protein [Croceitalea sp. F388]MDT0606815.1 hypothetical protein [Croceitalea sp. F388]